MERKLFCDLSPACYKIATEKEIIRRNIKDRLFHEVIANHKQEELLPEIVKDHFSLLLRELNGVDMQLQENKVTNIRLACAKVDRITLNPGETFSFWKTIGRPSEKNGYKEGLVIGNGRLLSGPGGGLCQLANLIHFMVLHSPLEVTELHHHTDALFPDERRRVPFGTGTSVLYNYVDYRFKNTTDKKIQIHVWIENGYLYGQLLSEASFPYRYKLLEENHHFRKEGNDYYRISQVYKIIYDKATNNEINKVLVLDNHSKVLYDHSLIPAEQIRN